MNWKQLYEKYRDVIPYLFFGVCTTLVNLIVYWVLAHPVGLGTMASTIAAWIAAVLFAYLTNRRWVFHSQAKGSRAVAREIVSFFACRLATGVVDWACMWLFVDVLHCDDVLIKFIANVIVVILNYIASKLVIFKGGKSNER